MMIVAGDRIPLSSVPLVRMTEETRARLVMAGVTPDDQASESEAQALIAVRCGEIVFSLPHCYRQFDARAALCAGCVVQASCVAAGPLPAEQFTATGKWTIVTTAVAVLGASSGPKGDRKAEPVVVPLESLRGASVTIGKVPPPLPTKRREK